MREKWSKTMSKLPHLVDVGHVVGPDPPGLEGVGALGPAQRVVVQLAEVRRHPALALGHDGLVDLLCGVEERPWDVAHAVLKVFFVVFWVKVEIGRNIGSQAPIRIPYAWPPSRARRAAREGLVQG